MRSEARQFVEHSIQSDFELLRCFINTLSNLLPNRFDSLMADIGKAVNSFQHTTKRTDLNVVTGCVNTDR